MPAAQKRKAGPPPAATAKKAKPDRPPGSPQKVKLAPLGERDINRAPAGCHRRKKDGSCRKDCQVCEHEDYEWRALNDPSHTFHSLYVCRAKGRDASPTPDHAGYPLDYDKVMDWFKPMTRDKLRPTPGKIKKQDAHFAKKHDEERQMLAAFFEEGAAPSDERMTFYTIDAIKERVETDTGVPWHKVGPSEVREWEKKGFRKAKKGEFTEFSREERDRLMKLEEGSALRK